MAKNAATCPLLTCAEMRALGLPVPELLARVETALGAAAMHSLVRGAGGRTVTVPHPRNVETSGLARACGVAVLAWLAGTYGHGPLIVPLGPVGQRALARQRIARALAAGDGIAAAAAAAGVHTRTAERIAASLRARGALPATKGPLP